MKRLKCLSVGFWGLLLSILHASATVYYVNVSNTAPVSPFTSWSTAATAIQDAVNLTSAGDEVLVADGVYQTGGVSNIGSNRVCVSSAILVQSVHGPAATVIQGNTTTNGASSVRCVYLAAGATLAGFTLTNGSTTTYGGGIYCLSRAATVSNCVIAGNSAQEEGGGGYSGTFNRCLFNNNVAFDAGGGACYCILNGCRLVGNTAPAGGGVAAPAAMTNCVVFGNNAGGTGGGVYCEFANVPIENCTIVGNYATYCGGVYSGSLINSIIYYNVASFNSSMGTNISTSTLIYNCCTSSTNGTGSNNIASAPAFVNVDGGDLHLQPWSPCIDIGNNSAVTSSTDLDGNPRVVNGVVDLGAYEFQDLPYPPVHFVRLSSPTPVAPFTTWATAATNLQDAIDAASAGDIIVASNGTYNVGTRVIYGLQTNRVAIDKAVTLQGLAGARYTAISGALNGTRCAYLTNGAVLLGFTLTNGGARFSGESVTNENGGGAWCESSAAIVSNCVFVANSAYSGGGSYRGTLVNCTLEANSASFGGGSFNSTLLGCTLSNNAALYSFGGGACGGFLNSSLLVSNKAACGGGACSNFLIGCTLIGNLASKSGGGSYSGALTNCTLIGNFATNSGGGAAYGNLFGCILSNNAASNGGGACSNALVNCSLVDNGVSTDGGGAAYCNLTDCIVSGNGAGNDGGGAYWSNLTNCLVIQNGAYNGGGLVGGVGYGCSISNNLAYYFGGVYSNTLSCSVLMSNNPGGSYYSTLNNCSLIMNIGGGSHHDNLNNCILVGNRQGDGADFSVLNNCTVIADYYSGGYGISFCVATNCIICSNYMANYWLSTMSYCCTTPLPSGVGNFTNAPLFLDDDFHLASNSPCIDAGNSSFAVGSADVDGRPRIVGSAVDVGATEFQGVQMEPFVCWLYQYGLPDDGSADYADSDSTGMSNWNKWIAGLNPTNSLSVLAMSSLVCTNNPAGVTVSWQSVTNVTYYVQRSSDLVTFTSIRSNLVGQISTTTYADSTATNAGPYYYRIGVQ